MERKIREMEQKLIAAGYPCFFVRAGSIRSFGTTHRYFEIEAGVNYERSSINEKFGTFDEMFLFVMTLKPRNPILFRKFSLAA